MKDFVLPMITDELWTALGIPDGWKENFPQFNKQDLIATATNGSKIYFRSCDREGDLRGPNLGWFYIDEAAKVSLNVWKIMVGRLRRPPEMGWISTTPKGRNWIWDEFAKRHRRNYEWWTGATSENTYLTKDYIESLKESYGGSFLRQEFYGEFTAWEGLVYPQINVEEHHKDAPADLSDYKYAIAGVDWGWADPSVILVGLVGTERIHVVEEFVKTRTPVENLAKKALELKNKWGIQTFWCDPSRPDAISKFKEFKLDARRGKNEIDDGIAQVSRAIEQKAIDRGFVMDFNACPETAREFEVYAYPEDDQGQLKKDKPIDQNNHCMDALRYMIYSNTKQGHASSRRGAR